jgi:hypothetical protein
LMSRSSSTEMRTMSHILSCGHRLCR